MMLMIIIKGFFSSSNLILWFTLIFFSFFLTQSGYKDLLLGQLHIIEYVVPMICLKEDEKCTLNRRGFAN
jgi:hypothetical protein